MIDAGNCCLRLVVSDSADNELFIMSVYGKPSVITWWSVRSKHEPNVAILNMGLLLIHSLGIYLFRGYGNVVIGRKSFPFR